jgi:hypothetical protein
MKTILLLSALALFSIPTTAAFAVPMCDGPAFDRLKANGTPRYSEEEMAMDAEMQLRSMGIDASDTRWWNGCLQTFVNENGHRVMKFYDPNSYREVPVN